MLEFEVYNRIGFSLVFWITSSSYLEHQFSSVDVPKLLSRWRTKLAQTERQSINFTSKVILMSRAETS